MEAMAGLAKVKIGMTRDEVVNILGQPDDMGGTSRKYKTPCVYLYGTIELHFAPWKAGPLIKFYTEDPDKCELVIQLNKAQTSEEQSI